MSNIHSLRFILYCSTLSNMLFLRHSFLGRTYTVNPNLRQSFLDRTYIVNPNLQQSFLDRTYTVNPNLRQPFLDRAYTVNHNLRQSFLDRTYTVNHNLKTNFNDMDKLYFVVCILYSSMCRVSVKTYSSILTAQRCIYVNNLFVILTKYIL